MRSFNCYSHNPPSFSERKRNKKCDAGKVHISLKTDNGFVYHIDTAERGGSPTTIQRTGSSEDIWDLPTIFALQSRRFVEYEFQRNEMSRYDYIHNQHSNYYNCSAMLNEFSSRLFNMYNHKEDFDPMLKRSWVMT